MTRFNSALVHIYIYHINKRVLLLYILIYHYEGIRADVIRITVCDFVRFSQEMGHTDFVETFFRCFTKTWDDSQPYFTATREQLSKFLIFFTRLENCRINGASYIIKQKNATGYIESKWRPLKNLIWTAERVSSKVIINFEL